MYERYFKLNGPEPWSFSKGYWTLVIMLNLILVWMILLIGDIFQQQSPSRNDGTLQVLEPPKGFPIPERPERPNEHAPGLQDMNA